MKKSILAVFLVAAAAAGLRAEIRFGGYLAFNYLKGQADSGYQKGSLQNLQAGLEAGGVLTSNFGFGLEIRSRTESLFEMEQAWIGFLPSKALNVRGGMYLVPFGAWNRANRPHETALISTPLNIQYLYPQSWRDLGLTVEGQIGILTYVGFIGNGLKEDADLQSGQQFTDNNGDKARGGRLGLVISQTIQAGVSFYSGKYDDQGQRNLTLEGADFSWVTANWEVHAEAGKAFIENPEPYAEGKSEGYSVWMVMGFAHVQPVGSFQRVKYADPYHGEAGIAVNQRRWTLGLRWIVGPSIFLKLEYAWNKDYIFPELKKNLFQAQAALAF
jgi:hypothetical protein